MDATIDQPRTRIPSTGDTRPAPGLLLVFTRHAPMLAALKLERGSLELGRGEVGGINLEDGAVSRRHAAVRYDGKKWHVQDLGSRNGTFVDGKSVPSEASYDDPKVLRIGGSLFLPTVDVNPYWARLIERERNLVVGPVLRAVLDDIAHASKTTDTLHVTGESGAGKELAARTFHEAGGGSGAFVAVNCAAIPEGLAERLLFGAKKGAYSGATDDAEGYIRAADGGTLFLDEVAELDASVQAKLLRVIETKEVLALGASRAKRVDVRVVSATLQSLRSLVAAKRFRGDLFFRIARPEVRVPPLRERREEIPTLIEVGLAKIEPPMRARPSLVESCLLRDWPGNVRELLAEIQDAARSALGGSSNEVDVTHLSPDAGIGFDEADAESEGDSQSRAPGVLPPREEIEHALRREQGNVARTARLLGLHRNQLRRWLDREGVNPRDFSD